MKLGKFHSHLSPPKIEHNPSLSLHEELLNNSGEIIFPWTQWLVRNPREEKQEKKQKED